MKKPSIKDIASHLKVSVSTVSLTLNGKGDQKRISQKTQERIITYAEKVNYKPNPFAKGLKNGSSDTIGLVIPNISDIFYARIARRIEKKAEQYGYNVVFSSTGENKEREKELIRSMLNRKVDGLIIASSQKNKESINGLQKSGVPFVLIDRYYPDIETDYVICDNKGGVKRAVEHLIIKGTKKIGLVSLLPELEVIKDRFRGYRDALVDNGLIFNPDYVKELSRDGYLDEMEGVYDYYQALEEPIEAIIFSTHYLAAAGLREMRKRGLKVPGDYKIVSYDEHNLFDLVEPPITCILQPVVEIGDRAVEILLNKLKTNDKEIKQVVLETGFIERKSCGE